MNLKRIVLALVAAMALSAVLAGNAFGTTEVITTENTWGTSTSAKWPVAEQHAVKCSKAGATNLILEGKVLGAETEITAENVECSTGAVLENVEVGGKMMAVGHGKLIFRGLSVMKPAGCGITTPVETTELEISISHHYENGVTTPKAFVLFKPVFSTTFATIKITGCAIAGSYPVKGTSYGESANETGVAASNQKLIFNAATNAVGTLTLGTEPAMITGEANNELTAGGNFEASL